MDADTALSAVLPVATQVAIQRTIKLDDAVLLLVVVMMTHTFCALRIPTFSSSKSLSSSRPER
jgi:hypothetical protein